MYNEKEILTISYSKQVTDASSQNWTWNKVFIDTSQTKNYPKKQKVGLVEHEVGHAMGLSHQPNNPKGSIMYNYDDERKFPNGEYRNRPSKKDCNNINHIYSNFALDNKRNCKNICEFKIIK